MPSRMDRYNSSVKVSKRTERNQNLYEEVKNYSELQEVEIEPIIKKRTTNLALEINNDENRKTKRVDKFVNIKVEPKKKVYDINETLEKAFKNRTDNDELEEKRKLKNAEYNITSQIDLNKIDQYKKPGEVLTKNEQEEVKEIINTIYSKKLKEDIDNHIKEEGNDLMSDLLPSDNDETIIDDKMASQMIESEKKEELDNLDESFYTRSMNLSEKDLVGMDTSFINDNNNSSSIKVIIVIVIGIVLALILYFIYKSL